VRTSEATYEVRLTAAAAAVPTLREHLSETLEAARYPASDIEVIDRPDGTAEIVAVLINTAVQSEELDAVVVALGSQPGVEHATWSARTIE
jgi:putative Mg2+ transporter-C (MgtC) family protein